ncbi:MAG: hypothetical protein QOJ67_590 [Acidimicrobiaceae bacterium]|jgi:hypothetical protein
MSVAVCERETRVAELMGIINSATAELTALIASVLEDGSWQLSGIRSPQHWVTWQCGVSPGRAHQLVTMARRRDELPACTELFDAGQLSEDALAAIAKRAPAERDAEVANLAPHLLHTQLVRVLGSLPKPEATPEPEPEPVPPKRDVGFGADEDLWRLASSLGLDEGALVELALRSARNQLFAERHPDDENPRTSTVTWADALVRLAELALTNLGGPGRPGDRFQVIVHLDPTDQTARLHLGPMLPDSLRRYLACDADLRAMYEHNGVLHAMTSRLRTVDDRMRCFIEHRDGGCRAPGCTQKRWLHIHHIVHWEDGGPTASPNLCALCPHHHRLHHHGQLGITGDPSTPTGLTFTDEHGRVIAPIPPIPPDEPPDPPPVPYVHPTGEHLDWRWIMWQDLQRWRRRHDPPTPN